MGRSSTRRGDWKWLAEILKIILFVFANLKLYLRNYGARVLKYFFYLIFLAGSYATVHRGIWNGSV